MRSAPLRDVLTLVDRSVPVVPSETYPLLGVRSFGAGAFASNEISGSETRYTRLLQVLAGDFVYPKLMAWEGAFAVVPEDLSGRFVSPEFCTFTAIDTEIDLQYLNLLFKRPETWAEIAGRSAGTNVRRRRLYPDDFLARTIPLPDLDQQREMAARLQELLSRAQRVAVSASTAATIDLAAIEGGLQAVLNSEKFPTRQLGEVADINPRPEHVSGRVAFVPMRAVDEKLGVIQSPELKDVDEIGSGYKQFRNGDVIFARITPCMENGKAAVVALEEVEVGLGSTEFHVVRPGPTVLPEWIHAIVRTRGFREAAAERYTGTAGQQRVPADFLRTAEILVPPLEDQRRLLERMGRIETLGQDLRRARTSVASRAQALGASLLNDAFRSIASNP